MGKNKLQRYKDIEKLENAFEYTDFLEDPFEKTKKKKKRLTSKHFLNRYRTIVKPDGIIHLKTDSESLFQFTIDVLKSENCTVHRLIEDVYREAPDDPLLTIQTFYEKQYLDNNKTIRYISFSA